MTIIIIIIILPGILPGAAAPKWTSDEALKLGGLCVRVKAYLNYCDDF
jgi:hypothetical protein